MLPAGSETTGVIPGIFSSSFSHKGRKWLWPVHSTLKFSAPVFQGIWERNQICLLPHLKHTTHIQKSFGKTIFFKILNPTQASPEKKKKSKSKFTRKFQAKHLSFYLWLHSSAGFMCTSRSVDENCKKTKQKQEFNPETLLENHWNCTWILLYV